MNYGKMRDSQTATLFNMRFPMKYFLLFLSTSFVMAGASAEVTLDTEQKKFSYTVGIQIGSNLKQGDEIDLDALNAAIKDAYTGNKYQLTVEEMQAVMGKYQEKQFAQRIEQSTDNKKAGDAFLEANKAKEGVSVTDSGLQYKIIKASDGKKPTASDSVKVHYHGTLIDGTVFDSSVERGEPIVFGVGQVIKGWQEALQLMPVGSKWQIYVPSELAYGERGAGAKIGPNATLIFDVELLGIE